MAPSDVNFRNFCGFIKIGGREFRVSVSSSCSSFSADKDLKHILAPCMALVRDRLKVASNAHEFLVELRDLAERQIAQEKTEVQIFESGLPPAHFYERLLTEISGIGWANIAYMNESMRVLDLLVEDAANRKHSVNVSLPADYPVHPPKCVAALPVDFELQWGRDSTLVSVRRQCQKLVDKYQDFFRAMEDLDANSWVLEPEHPTTRDTYRRVALGKTCSMRVEVDPRAPVKGFPDIRFLGSEAAIEPFRERLNQNIQNWDMSGKSLPRENLERVLEVTLPKPEEEDGADGEGNMLECGICYAYRLDDALPDIACDLAECSKPYHRACLVEWLRALPDTRESFGTITGCCVYCEEPISVSVTAE